MIRVHNNCIGSDISLNRAVLVTFFLLLAPCLACAVDWQYNPPHTGRVLDEGGWIQEYNLGSINASPEFSFPLQLVYLNTRANSGLFGPQWFCPQLESSVVPQAEGVFLWRMPSGTVDVFRAQKDSNIDYFDTSRQWYARYSPDRQLIQNQEGWLYEYRRGHLFAVTSPTNRVLVFNWIGDVLQGIQLQDGSAGQGITLFQAAYTESKRINNLVFGTTQHQFAYFPGRDGRLSDWIAANKQAFSFTYADVGILEYVKDSTGTTLTFTTSLDNPALSADDQKNPAHWRLVQDPDQKYAYTADGQLTVTGGTGISETKADNPQRGIVTETFSGGQVRTTYYYRAPGQKYDGKLRRIEENDKVLVEYYYNRKTGLLTSMVDEHGTMIHFDYPDDWRPTPENPWDPKPIRVWKGTPDHPQILAYYQYDAGGHVIAMQDQAGQVTRYAYDNRNELGAVTNPQGVTTTIAYDSLGRPVHTQTGSQSQSIGYDIMGRVISQSSSDGGQTNYEYDALGNVVKISRNGKVVTEYVRDATGKLTGIKDALGRLKKVEADNHGNITANYAPDGSCTKYEYDTLNRLVSQTDGNGNKTTFAYDPAGHLILQTNPLGETISWAYDAKGRLLTKKTAEQSVVNSYDDDGHLVSTDYGGGHVVNFAYDDQDRLVSATTPQTSLTTVYDPSGSLAALRYSEGQEEQLVRFRYNAAGQRTGLLLAHLRSAVAPAGDLAGKDAGYDPLQQTEYTYDSSGRLGSILSNGTPVVTYQYDAQNRLIKKTYGNGMTADLSYDALGRLAQIVWSRGPITSPLTLAYEWDAADQVTRRAWNGEIQRYEYTPNGQLARVLDDKTGTLLEAYTYDKAGNMVEKTLDGRKTTLAYNAANELTSSFGPDGSFQYSYDKAGRVVGSALGTTTYGWLDKPVQITGAGGQAVALTYWPDGQLADKATAAGHEPYLWDGLALLRRGDTIYITEPHANGGTVVASHPINQPGKICYYMNDLLGTSLASVNNNEIEITKLTSFGQKTNTKPVSTQAPAPNPAIITPPPSPLPPSTQDSPFGTPIK